MKLTLPAGYKGKEAIQYMVENKADLIRIAKATIKEADNFSLRTLPEASVLKTVGKQVRKAQEGDSLDVTVVGNTYWWMDSHDDVHIDGIFTKSIQETGTRVLHLHDHVQQLVAKVGRPKQVYEKNVLWKDVNVNLPGFTTALMMDSDVLKSYNAQIFNDYADGEIDQHSVGMQYVQLFLAVNDQNYKEEFAAWNRYYPNIGNKERADERGFFWAVTEAKLVEISCVIAGSNELTPTWDVKNDTTTEPPSGTQAQPSAENKGHFFKLKFQN